MKPDTPAKDIKIFPAVHSFLSLLQLQNKFFIASNESLVGNLT